MTINIIECVTGKHIKTLEKCTYDEAYALRDKLQAEDPKGTDLRNGARYAVRLPMEK